ncbi:dihydroorotase [Limosilactobacillus caecicola]|uniref:dihydroorotase n=1 Tax=Limosilactobacillus caecicola TaxID=2941332 RepID=UPI00203E3D03|nr:dihydroorotase [Limosilactobacillus caecicola]
MTTLIQNGQVYTNGQLIVADVVIDNDRITAIGEPGFWQGSIDQRIDATNKLVSPGLVDVHVHYRDPGETQKETIHTGSLAAAHGGFTTVGAMPNLDPAPDTPARVAEMVRRNQQEGVVHIAQFATITTGRQGDQLVDFAGVKKAGAFAVSNDGSGVQTAGTMYQAMKGAAAAGLPLAAHVEDNSLLFGGVMTASDRSRQLGLPGAPSVSESAQVARDLVLAKTTGVHYHICHVSTKESIAMVRFAKQQGVNVTCEVTPHHLLLTVDDIDGHDTNYKMNPPLRTKADQQALIAGLQDGTIDMIATDHAPHTVADKPADFTQAANGITGSETAFAELYTNLVKPGTISLTKLLDLMSAKPADLFNLNQAGHLEPGRPADLAIFDLQQSTRIQAADYQSKGINTPFTGDQVYGDTVLTMVDGHVVYQRKEG